MVTPEELATLDLLIWLRTGQLVGDRLDCNQSTVSRRVAHCSTVFGLRVKRLGGEWQVRGQSLLLALERQVHQTYRLLGGAPLRLECTAWDATALALPAPDGWCTGVFDHMGTSRPLQLLRERIIDAWISSCHPDLPDPQDPDLLVLPLSRMPLWLVAADGHPLAGAAGLTAGDLERFPSLALPPGELPTFERVLRRQGLWSEPVRVRRYSPSDWEGRSADGVTLSYSNPVGRRHAPQLVQLDWDLGLEGGQALVVRRDLAEQGPIQLLLELLIQRVSALREQAPALQPL